MKKSYILALLAYLIPTFPLGYAWHLVTFVDNYHRLDLFRDDVIIPLGLGSMLIQAAIFTWLYPRVFSTGRTKWLSGAIGFFAVFGTLGWSFMVLPVAAKYRMTSVPDFMTLETAFTILQYLIVAPLIALAHRDRG